MSVPTLAIVRIGSALRVYRLSTGAANYLGDAAESDYGVAGDALVLRVAGCRYLVTLPTCDQCGAAYERADGGLALGDGRHRFCDEDCRAEWRHNH